MEEFIRSYFASYVYHPYMIYGGILAFMMASGFGLPIPEEVILVSAGFIGYLALNPDLNHYPPPYVGAPTVNVYVLAAVALASVMAADFLIYSLGKRFGPRFFRTRFFSRLMTPERMSRAQAWVKKYGYFTVFIFRFTPGVRFPGHLMCGAMGLSPYKFVGVDGFAAMISVPTQVLLVSFYGETIMHYLKEFKLIVFGIIVVVGLYFLLRHLAKKFLSRPA